jgi:hypothetical protein
LIGKAANAIFIVAPVFAVASLVLFVIAAHSALGELNPGQ